MGDLCHTCAQRWQPRTYHMRRVKEILLDGEWHPHRRLTVVAAPHVDSHRAVRVARRRHVTNDDPRQIDTFDAGARQVVSQGLFNNMREGALDRRGPRGQREYRIACRCGEGNSDEDTRI